MLRAELMFYPDARRSDHQTVGAVYLYTVRPNPADATPMAMFFLDFASESARKSTDNESFRAILQDARAIVSFLERHAKLALDAGTDRENEWKVAEGLASRLPFNFRLSAFANWPPERIAADLAELGRPSALESVPIPT